MRIYENPFYFFYDESLSDVLLSDLIAEFAAQEELPGFGQHPNYAIHKSAFCKEPLEIHTFKFAGESQPWFIHIYNNREALIGSVGGEFEFYERVGIFVYEHRTRIADEDGEETFNAFAKEFNFEVWMWSLLSGGKLE